MDFGKLFFSFDGRINRAAFWLGTLIVWVVLIVAAGLFARDSSTLFIYGIIAVIAIWPALAISIKRWHDRDKSGWWVLIAFVPVIGGIWALVETGFLPGTTGPNQYGPDPLAAPTAQ